MTTRSPNTSNRRDELRESDRPFVRLNLAITADGKIATANRAISSFGSKHDLKRLYQLRHRADAILCGATTINAENADLGPAPGKPAYPPSAGSRLPLRVIASGRGHLNPEARLFQRAYGPIVILTTRRISAARRRRLESLAHTVKVCGAREIDFVSALRWLRSKWNVRELLCEGGSQVNGALLAADLVDEINLTLCPWIVGGRTAPTLADGHGVPDLAHASHWRLEQARRRADELFLTYRRLRQQTGLPTTD
ncbi:MAG: RibD family protein [Verrucomicrobia bacterium]|nr:RibD family protein [Verrucomicrobiota bacterium]